MCGNRRAWRSFSARRNTKSVVPGGQMSRLGPTIIGHLVTGALLSHPQKKGLKEESCRYSVTRYPR